MPATVDDLDLWADDIKPGVLSPLIILRAQEPALRKKTNGIVQAKVVSQRSGIGLKHELLLLAPAIDNYQEKILVVQHQTQLVYPCQVESPSFGEYRTPEFRVDGIPISDPLEPVQTADSEADFRDLLRKVLTSKRVRSTIDALLAKSNELNLETKTVQPDEDMVETKDSKK